MGTRRTTAVLAGFLAASLLASACASGEPRPLQASASPSPDSAGGGWLDGSPAEADARHRGAGGSPHAETDAGGEGAYDGMAAAPGEPRPAGGGGAAEPGDAPHPLPREQSGGPLRAGWVDDNEDFADYLAYRELFARTGIHVHDVDVTERHVVRVRTPDGAPVLGATVEAFAGSTSLGAVRTYSDGRALFFPLASTAPDAESYRIVVSQGAAAAEVTVGRGSATHEVELDVPPPGEPVRLDVLFLLDATGSMGDEIDRLKATIDEVAAQIVDLPEQPDVRFGMTVYRDRGDAFVTRTFDFTTDVSAFRAALGEVTAEGGGDEPEALNEALHAAIHLPSWRVDDTVSLIFLVADAPPHLDYPDDEDYAVEVFEAAARGIKIVPLASSGTNNQAEYIFRQLAQITLAPFLFLTYGPDGEPGDGTTHSVSGYDVLSLDELIVRVVDNELGALRGRSPAPPQQ